MTQSNTMPARRQGWYPLKRSFTNGRSYQQFNIVISLTQGMSFAHLKEEMEDIELEFGKAYDNHKFEIVTRHDLNGDEINEIMAFGFREETNDEYKARLDESQAREFEQEQRERAELVRLTQKYANKG